MDLKMLLFRFRFAIPIVLLALSSSFPHALAHDMEEILPPQLQRQVVFYRTTEAPGTIIVHTSERHLHLYVVQGNGVRCATASPQWQGLLKIARKQEWPDWTPPPKMIERQPYLPRFMAGGPGIPPGARALSRHGTSAARCPRGAFPWSMPM
jgi:lipoprotein-anchoring transpeptidase ErfK/SrfK